MKKIILILIALFFFGISNSVEAQRFWKVNNDGDTLYYNVLSAVIPYSVEITYKGSDYQEFSDEYDSIISIPSTVIYNSITYDVKSIGENAFRVCNNIDSVIIPNSINSIGSCAFSNSSIKSISLPSSVNYIGEWSFRYCFGLTNFYVPSTLTHIDFAALYGCWFMQNINVDANNPNYSSINGVLYNKLGDTLICCPGAKQGAFFVTSNVNYIADLAFCYGNLSAINVDANNINYSSLDGILYNKIMDTLIACTTQKTGSVIIPTSVSHIYWSSFFQCNQLSSVAIPSSVSSIGDFAFAYCDGLTSINIPNSITQISMGAFYDCPGLTSITIPALVASIGDQAFSYCTGLNEIKLYPEIPPQIVSSTFEGVSDTIPVLVPCNSLTLYQGAEYWSDFTNYDCFVGLDNLLINNLSTKLYPNPASDIVSLEINNTNREVLTLNIYNIMGFIVKTETISKYNNQINVSELNNGIYLILIKSKDLIREQKLVIQR